MSAEPVAPDGVYRFDGFELRLRTRELLRHGEPVELQPKVLDLIAYLLAHRDRAIDKNELLDAVWPRQVVTEAALARSIMKARRALDDDAEQPRRILTVHGRGYRFMAQLDAADAAGGETTPRDASPRAAPIAAPSVVATTAPRTLPPRRIAMLLAALGVALVLLWFWRSSPGPGSESGAVPIRIAILPTQTQTEEPRLDWSRLGLAGVLHDYLGQHPRISTVPMAQTLRLLEHLTPDLDADAALVGLARRFQEAHGASHLVVTRIEPRAGRWRLRYRLVGHDGRIRDRTLVDATPGDLMRGLGADLVTIFGSAPTQASDVPEGFANEAWLRGKAALLRGDLEAAELHLRVAVTEAPEALWPRLDLAILERNRRAFDLAEPQFEALLQQARARGNRPVEIAALVAMGNLYLMSERIELAEARWRDALVLARAADNAERIATVLMNLALATRIRGDHAATRALLLEAHEQFGRAGFEHPPARLAMSLGTQAQQEGDTAAAERYLQQAMRSASLAGDESAEIAATFNLATLRRDLGLLEQAHALVSQVIDLHRRRPHDERNLSSAIANLAWVEILQGRPDAALRRLPEAAALAHPLRERIPLAFVLRRQAQAELALGRLDDADTSLQQAAELYREGRLPQGELQIAVLQAELALRRGDAATAAARIASVRDQPGLGAWPEIEVDLMSLQAQLAALHGPLDPALAAWQDAADACRAKLPQNPLRCSQLQLDAARALRAAGRETEAQRIAGTVREQLRDAPGLQEFDLSEPGTTRPAPRESVPEDS